MPDRRPTVALVAHGIHDHGGMERAFFELVRRTHARFRFVVVSAELDEQLRPFVDWRRIRVPMRPIPLKFVVFFLVAGLRLLRVRADVVHSLGAIVPNRVDVATVQFCHAGQREAGGRLAPAGSPLLRRLNTTLSHGLALLAERWCYRPRRVRLLAPVSAGIEDELRKHYPGIDTRLTPNGVDLERFRPNPRARAELRRAHRVSDAETVALFVGGDWDRKGVAVALEALANARRRGVAARLWVVGRGDVARFTALGRRLGVGDFVTFHGPRRDTERFYAAADVFVLPTLYEAAPLVAYEAAASALPLVATAANGVVDLLAAGGAGVLVTRDPESVGAALACLAEDPRLRLTLARQARRRAERYDWETAVDAVTRAYGELQPGEGAIAGATA